MQIARYCTHRPSLRPTGKAAVFLYTCRLFIRIIITRVSSLAFETLLFVLTLVAFFRHVKSVYRRHSILVVFVRDGTWAYALIFGARFRGAQSRLLLTLA